MTSLKTQDHTNVLLGTVITHAKSISSNREKVYPIKPSSLLYTQESYELVAKVLDAYAKPKDLILDPMAGVGGVVYAAEQFGFTAIGVEIKEELVKIANRRLGTSKVRCGDSRELHRILPEEYCNMVYIDPPLPNVNPECFPDSDPLLREFRATEDVYFDNMKRVITESINVLKTDGRCIVSSKNILRPSGEAVSVAEKFLRFGQEAGCRSSEVIGHIELCSIKRKVKGEEFLCLLRK